MDSQENTRPIKMMLIGDWVGKTSMLNSYLDNGGDNLFQDGFESTILNCSKKNATVDGIEYPLELWDITGDEGYERLRASMYPEADCILFCFALDNPTSLANIDLKWIPEMLSYCTNPAVILVGTKSDLRTESSPSPSSCISPDEARYVKGKINADAYIECSAKTRDNVNKVFEQAVRSVMNLRKAMDGGQARLHPLFLNFFENNQA